MSDGISDTGGVVCCGPLPEKCDCCGHLRFTMPYLLPDGRAVELCEQCAPIVAPPKTATPGDDYSI